MYNNEEKIVLDFLNCFYLPHIYRKSFTVTNTQNKTEKIFAQRMRFQLDPRLSRAETWLKWHKQTKIVHSKALPPWIDAFSFGAQWNIRVQAHGYVCEYHGLCHIVCADRLECIAVRFWIILMIYEFLSWLKQKKYHKNFTSKWKWMINNDKNSYNAVKIDKRNMF